MGTNWFHHNPLVQLSVLHTMIDQQIHQVLWNCVNRGSRQASSEDASSRAVVVAELSKQVI